MDAMVAEAPSHPSRTGGARLWGPGRLEGQAGRVSGVSGPPTARVVAVESASPAALAGVLVGDEVVTVDGERPRDVIGWRQLTDEADIELEILRGGLTLAIEVPKRAGEPLGIEVHSAVFDQVRTCDNHCEFCFIYQLPPGMRKSLYLKDDDYRLSFLYGNFTTLTRFTEADLERVITEGLSPLNVSIHATDHAIRNRMLRNSRGGPSLRWLRALLDHGVEVHGQIVVCPGVNDGDVLDDTLCGILDEYPELASVAVVPLGISQFSHEAAMRAHTLDEANRVVDLIVQWQTIFLDCVGHRMVFAADEYYLLTSRGFPEPDTYEGFRLHEDGIGMARTFEMEFNGLTDTATGPQAGFFKWVDGTDGTPYRAPRNPDGVTSESESSGELAGAIDETDMMTVAPISMAAPRPFEALPANPAESTGLRRTGTSVSLKPGRKAPIGILTAPYGAQVLRPLLAELNRPDIRIIEVENRFFGGNIAVTGLMCGPDLARVLSGEPVGHRYLLPDVCLSDGRFLDGSTVADLPRPVDVIPTDGIALRQALGLATERIAS
jgi:putative radical SAM enzyme (TIGR03279 family)